MKPLLQQPIPLGIGYYSVADAARLLRRPARVIRRWMGGHTYFLSGEKRTVPPLWSPQLPTNDNHIELGFRDLIEMRFVAAFVDQGLALHTIRVCLDTAREVVGQEHPFSTGRFKTDGKRIFVETVHRLEIGQAGTSSLAEAELLDLKSRQYTFPAIIQRTFRDLDIEADAVARWRPFNGKASIVLDPARAFGQPILADFGIPTAAISGALSAEGDAMRVAFLYDVPVGLVRDAARFENELAAA